MQERRWVPHHYRVLVGHKGDGTERPVQHELHARQGEAHALRHIRGVPPQPLPVISSSSEGQLQLAGTTKNSALGYNSFTAA
jgi:hypothetical protein